MTTRVRSIDWLRGLVVMLMTIDHSGTIFDSAHMHGDNSLSWVTGSPLPAGEFLTRWITHLCAPTFIMLAGAAMAFMKENQTRFLITRGLFIAALDPLWMGLGFTGFKFFPLAVLYAIGMSMVLMAALRKLPSTALFAGALAICALAELSAPLLPGNSVWQLLFVGGKLPGGVRVIYSLIPWLPMMMFGLVLGRFLRTPGAHARSLLLVGLSMLAAFVVLRGLDGYGNWNLHRDSSDVLQWLHVSKYPPSLSFILLELGIAFVLLSAFVAVDNGPRPLLEPLLLFGSTAFFYYLLHVHFMQLIRLAWDWDPANEGLAKTWGIAAFTLLALAYPCVLFRRFKRAHPHAITRYI